MTTEKAIEILEYHNKWRREKVSEMKYTAKDLGIAIDLVLCDLKRLRYYHVHNASSRPSIIEVSKKMEEAENLVKDYIKKNKKPPSYGYVAKKLGIKKTAAYGRLRHCRELMTQKINP